MELYKPTNSRNWHVTYNINGKRYRATTGTPIKRQAEAFIAKLQTEIYEGRHFPDKKKNELTMEGLRDRWFARAQHKRSFNKDQQRFRAILDFFGPSRLVITLTQEDCEAFRDELAKRITRRGTPMAPATVNRHLALLRAALRHVRRDYHHRDPMQGVKFLAERNKRERECEKDELDRLLAAADPPMRLAIVLARETGLREGEVCSATRAQINLYRREIHVPSNKAKNDEGRTVPLSEQAYEELKAAPARVDGRLVGLSADALSERFTALTAKVGIEGLWFHDLRGTAITRLARAGATLDELQQFSGHKSVQALMRYLKRGDKRLRSLVDRMDEIESGQGAQNGKR